MQDTAGSYRSDRRYDTRGVACFTFFDDDTLFPGNGTGSGDRLTNGPHPAFSVAESLFRRGRQREEERNSLVGRIRVRVCRLRKHRTMVRYFLPDETRNWMTQCGTDRYRSPNSHMVIKCEIPPRVISNYLSYRAVNINIHASLIRSIE